LYTDRIAIAVGGVDRDVVSARIAVSANVPIRFQVDAGVIARLDVRALAPSTTAATLKTRFAMINTPFAPLTLENAGACRRGPSA
jgi:hypothetical protein